MREVREESALRERSLHCERGERGVHTVREESALRER